ncbi:hypothetical protein PLICRDRAFT_42887 [Plicaturopsis crispa FD-325 SS-3]|nr:hypothetical protein PLICRDRAFT_42887 [Plicaturopsis crispa FD-325 SS-3]
MSESPAPPPLTSDSSKPRQKASTALWTHLLSRTARPQSSASSATQLLPIDKTLLPIDKTGTSTRLLLHDTHAQLERFSARVDTLVKEVERAGDAVREVGGGCEVRQGELVDHGSFVGLL